MLMEDYPTKHGNEGQTVQIEYATKDDEAEHVQTEFVDEPVAHLHAKTFLVVFAVLTIYFAQLFNIVAAGAASRMSSFKSHIS